MMAVSQLLKLLLARPFIEALLIVIDSFASKDANGKSRSLPLG